MGEYNKVLLTKRITIKCPKCGKLWKAARYWTGNGMLREYCRKCRLSLDVNPQYSHEDMAAGERKILY